MARTMLQFDYEQVHGHAVSRIVGHRDRAAGWTVIALLVEGRAMVLRVDPDTDEIIVTLEDVPDLSSGWEDISEFASFTGRPLGWCWIGRNYLGYLDMFTLSFAALEPQICCFGEGSTLQIRLVGEARE